MTWLNEHEIDRLVQELDPTETPNLALGARRLRRLAYWANTNSDGWHVWPLPGRAAGKLQELLTEKARGLNRFDPRDCTDRELVVATAPIKAFLTKRHVDHAEIIDDPPPDPRWMVTGPALFTPNEVPQTSIRAGLLDMITSNLPGIKKIEVTLADDAGKIIYELVTA